MRKRLAIVLMACVTLVAAHPYPAHAQVDISAGIQINAVADFNAPLAPYGSWVQVGQYGRCWHPAQVAADWQPYTVGSWQYSDAGWYWQSDEPFAWACYHYGSWYDEPSIGWVWVPGTQWAPAWVTWRDSDDYIGWAPCGPGMSVLAPSLFVFCSIGDFHHQFRSRHDFIVNNTTIINRTRVIKDFNRRTVDIDGHQRTIFANGGPPVDRIQRATGAKFTPRLVRDVFVQSHHPQNVRGTQGQRPEERNAEQQQRRETPAPTGREQQRNYQQPAQQHPTPAPTGREQQRNYQEQQRSQDLQRQQEQRQLQQKTPQPAVHPQQQAPQNEQRRDINPPTGRETPRVYPETPKPTPVEPKHEVPAPNQKPVAPQERPLPPTGRNEVPHPQQPHEITPPQPREKAAPAPAPSVRPTPANPDGGHRDGDGHDRRDGQ